MERETGVLDCLFDCLFKAVDGERGEDADVDMDVDVDVDGNGDVVELI